MEKKSACGKSASQKKLMKAAIVAALLLVVAIVVVVCVTMAADAPNRQAYEAAQELMESGRYEEAAEAFRALDDYADSSAQAVKCYEILEDQPYQAALAMKNEGRYEEAAEAFYQLYGYRDSYDQYQECLNLAKEEAYQAAVAMMNEKRYDEAIERFRELKDYKDSADQIAVCQEQLRAKQYETAVERMDAGDYAGAYDLFADMKDYKNVKRLISGSPELSAEREKALAVGKTVTFGRYHQYGVDDTDTPIRWLILARDGEKALLVSEQVLAVNQFHDKRATGGWGPSTLREWMNSTFLNEVFTANERSVIQNTETVITFFGAPEIKDKVFLLSREEVMQYLPTEVDRMAAPTAYALRRAPTTNEDKTAAAWWLRDTGKSACAMLVTPAGVISEDGTAVYVDSIGIRPAVWVNLSDSIF